MGTVDKNGCGCSGVGWFDMDGPGHEFVECTRCNESGDKLAALRSRIAELETRIQWLADRGTSGCVRCDYLILKMGPRPWVCLFCDSEGSGGEERGW